ncbi:putative ferric-chelate reductase 1 [Scomber scombrus]|uniref:putative ferric-chelate reductase 1 n=1 Tax=Scomber scombrus TaxID=13677 RepID=UPI002DDB670D|nr:putative ferric-chelate reductase 1 [Scomber scombrus]
MDHVVLLLLLLLLLCVAPTVHCYSSGLVTASCADLRPRHNKLSPQTGPAPYTITTDRSSYRLGEEVTVKIQAPSSKPFFGFLLQARQVGLESPVGYFTLTTMAAQILTCSQRPSSAVSHNSVSAKTSIQVTWRSELSGNTKPVQFHASFVQNFKTFWVDVTSPALTFFNNISKSGCGVTKVCISQPLNCDPAVSVNCYFMSASITPNDTAVHYEITGPSDGYISFGFSDDQRMGNDDIYICGIGSNGLVQLQHAISTGKTAPRILPLGNVSDVVASVHGMVISCSFTSMNPISTQRTSGFNMAYYLMYAHGPSSNGLIQFHADTFISSDKIDISRPQLVTIGVWPPIIKVHGSLMLIAWMTTGSLGMMVARYLKGLAKGQNLWGKDVWFLVHVAVMSLTVVATAIAFILSFSYAKDWSGGAHPVLGCLVMIMSFLQPILAMLRCGPQHALRFLFNWTHALNAVVIKTLAVAATCTGLMLIDSTPEQWLIKVMGGFIGWEAFFYILLEVHLKWPVNTTDTLESSTKSVDVLLMTLFFVGNLAFLVALLVGIGIS